MLAHRRVMSSRACLAACTFLGAGFSLLSLTTPGVQSCGGLAMRRAMDSLEDDPLNVLQITEMPEYPGTYAETAKLVSQVKFGLEIDFEFKTGTTQQEATEILKQYCKFVMRKSPVGNTCTGGFITAAIHKCAAEFKTSPMMYSVLVSQETQESVTQFIYDFPTLPSRLPYPGAGLQYMSNQGLSDKWNNWLGAGLPVELLREGGIHINMDIGAFQKKMIVFSEFYIAYNKRASWTAALIEDNKNFLPQGAYDFPDKIYKSIARNAHGLRGPICLVELAVFRAYQHRLVLAWTRFANPRKAIPPHDPKLHPFDKFLQSLLLFRTFFANYFWLMMGVPLTNGEIDAWGYYNEHKLNASKWRITWYVSYFKKGWDKDVRDYLAQPGNQNGGASHFLDIWGKEMVAKLFTPKLLQCAQRINAGIVDQFFQAHMGPNTKLKPGFFDPHYDKANIEHAARGDDFSRIELRDHHRSLSFANDLRQVSDVREVLLQAYRRVEDREVH